MDELALLAEDTFIPSVNAYKLTTGQGHSHNPTSIEKTSLPPYSALITPPSTPPLPNVYRTFGNKQKQKQLQNRLHHLLIASKNIKHAIRNIRNANSTPPISFYGPTSSLDTSPADLCGTRGQTLNSGLPTRTQTHLLPHGNLRKILPSCESPSFTHTYFDSILAQASPTEASD